MADSRVGVPVKPRRERVGRRIARSDLVLNFEATVLAAGLRFVNATSPIIFEGETPEASFAANAPMIVTAWHGQAFMLPFVRPRGFAVDVLASRHLDGELIARTLTRLGCGVIRGSGAADPARMHEKGAVSSFRGMKAALDAGRSVAMTADFDRNKPRRAGEGVIALARLTGRPLVAIGFASSRRREIGSTWDKTTISLPFGRAVCVIGAPIRVARSATPEEQEAQRLALEASLNATLERALARADGRD